MGVAQHDIGGCRRPAPQLWAGIEWQSISRQAPNRRRVASSSARSAS